MFLGALKNRSVTPAPERSIGAERSRRLELIEERIRLATEKASSSPSPTAKAPPAKTASQPKAPEKSCWERIRDQFQTSPDYLAESSQRLKDIVGPWYYANSNTHPSGNIEEFSLQGKFFLALAKADLLKGTKVVQDEDSALRLLEQVAAADPQNSAPLLFAAIIENRRGNRERSKEFLKETNRSSHFNSYLKDFTFALFDGVRTPSDLLTAQEIWSTAPVPDYMALREILKESKQQNVASQLVEDGLRIDRDRITDLSWIPIEYAVGKRLLDSYGKGTDMPEYRDLLQQHPSTLEQSGERIVSKLDSTCDIKSIEDEVETVRTYLNQVRAK